MTGFFLATAVFWLAAGPSGELAFVAGTEQDDQRVCILNVESGAITPIGPGQGDGAPVWSPDGTWLAFESRNAKNTGIVIARADGSETRVLPHQMKWNLQPRWAPDSARLVYCASADNDFDRRCVVYDLAAKTETVWGGDTLRVMRTAWLPNMKLLYALRPDQEIELSDGQGGLTLLDWLEKGSVLLGIGIKQETVLTTCVSIIASDATAELPDWVFASHGNYVEWYAEPSPTGEGLAFESNDGGDREIFVLTKKGLLDVSNHRSPDWNPVWSPDGNWLAFESFRDGRRGIYRAYRDTARISPLAVTPTADNWAPTWAPNGKWIAFVSDRDGKPDLYASDIKGNETIRLTKSAQYAIAPAWKPKAKKK